ncbi:MAG: hypothetical protein ABSA41_03745 [Terriglobia bacterium]|jgi:hypothetical protein
MSIDVEETALMGYLARRSRRFHEKVLELRECIGDWLAYIPNTFPHYTQHTVKHSDAIIDQLSKLLFKEGKSEQAVVELSPAEGYILAAAAYLHDAGMVVSDREKSELLQSTEWKNWIGEGEARAKRLRDIAELRKRLASADPIVGNFLADLQTRFLIAEFVRRTHHYRAAKIITHDQAALARFAFDDPIAVRTISDICIAHGLRQHELEDREKYPDQRDVLGDQVNVRFLALLLRLGDLLDMSSDRACPLMLNAACPLPPESLAQWSQYRRITHRLTSPDRIELTAECNVQEEHRYLQDWCQWLADEVRNARSLMSRATRHRTWQPPVVELEGSAATITIRPSADASYIPSKWHFELDSEIVFDRLINDVSPDPNVFIRELIQNGLDAARCQIYADLAAEGMQPPRCPTQVDPDRRRRYPIQIALRTVQVKNELSGETEARQLLTVDDCGIGMDRDVIRNYFLQVGRSYYTTEEFRRNFHFVPTSRFGVGFLSVFAVSDHVVVETFKPSSPSHDGPIRLTLTGPRNYLLTDRGTRRSTGTSISVLLRKELASDELTRLVKGWCRRVELPVIVNDLGKVTTISAEGPEQFVGEFPDVTEEGAKFVVRSFPVNRQDVEGEIYVLAHVGGKGERWDLLRWAESTYPQTHPLASAPPFPGSVTCLHGVAVSDSWRYYRGAFSTRLDYRGDIYGPTLARHSVLHRRGVSVETGAEIESRLEEILKEHLATSTCALPNESWKYKQRLAGHFPLPSFWASEPGTIRVFRKGQPDLISLSEAQATAVITTVVGPWMLTGYVFAKQDDKAECPDAFCELATPTISGSDLNSLSDEHRAALFTSRIATSVHWLASGYLAVDWTTSAQGCKLLDGYTDRPVGLAALPNGQTIGFAIHKTTNNVYECCLLNQNHPFVSWLLDVKHACEQGCHGLNKSQLAQLISLLQTPLRLHGFELSKLVDYLDGWRALPGLPADLSPPPLELTRDAFTMKPVDVSQ